MGRVRIRSKEKSYLLRVDDEMDFDLRLLYSWGRVRGISGSYNSWLIGIFGRYLTAESERLGKAREFLMKRQQEKQRVNVE